MNHESLQHRYHEETMKFYASEQRDLTKKEAKENCLFVDQRLLVMIAYELNILCDTFVNEVAPVEYHHPSRGWPQMPARPQTEGMGMIPEWLIDPESIDPRKVVKIDHTWTAKSNIAKSRVFARKFIEHKLKIVRSLSPKDALHLEAVIARLE